MGLKAFFRAVMGRCDTRRLPESDWNLSASLLSFEAANAPELAKGGGVYLEGGGLSRPILVWQDGGGGLKAVINRCTHAGHRMLDPVEGPDGMVLRCCSVSHSVFDLAGKPVKGPAKDPLDLLDVEQKGDMITVRIPG